MNSTQLSKTIETEAEYRETSKTLSQKKRPAAVLRMLMNSFESYRQTRKFGWSRPWNKYDLMNFQSFRLNVSAYPWFLQTAKSLLQAEASISEAAVEFYTDLLADNKLMGFVFVHEFTQDGKQYEGATLSLGRVNNKRFRDRIDIIVESPVIDGVSQGFQRTRIYIDPYREDEKKPLWQGESASDGNPHGIDLFAVLSTLSWQWANDEQHLWDHWTSAYIDYFGERQWPMSQSYFYVENNPTSRLEMSLPAGFELDASKAEVLEGAA